jgi:hypothetical protein
MFKLIPVLFLLALNLNADKADEARSAASSARLNAIGSQGAVQVTQVHTEAQTRILVNLVEQNDQIIAALKDIAAAKGNPTQEVSTTVKALSEEIGKIQKDSLKLLKSQGDEVVKQQEQVSASIKALLAETARVQNESLKLLKSQGDEMVQQHQNMIKSIHEQKHEVLPKFDKMQAILVGLQCVSTMGILVIAMRRKLASQ